MNKFIGKLFIGLFATISIVSLGFTVSQIFIAAPQLSDIMKDFLAYISVNLFGIIGLALTSFVTHEASKKQMNDLYEELTGLNTEDNVVFAKMQEFSIGLITNPESAHNPETKQRLKELLMEYEQVATKSEKALLKLIGKIVNKETE